MHVVAPTPPPFFKVTVECTIVDASVAVSSLHGSIVLFAGWSVTGGISGFGFGRGIVGVPVNVVVGALEPELEHAASNVTDTSANTALRTLAPLASMRIAAGAVTPDPEQEHGSAVAGKPATAPVARTSPSPGPTCRPVRCPACSSP